MSNIESTMTPVWFWGGHSSGHQTHDVQTCPWCEFSKERAPPSLPNSLQVHEGWSRGSQTVVQQERLLTILNSLWSLVPLLKLDWQQMMGLVAPAMEITHLLTLMAEGIAIPDMHSRDEKFVEYLLHSRQWARYTADPAGYIQLCSLLSILAHEQLSSCFISQGPHCLWVIGSKHNNSRTKRKAQQQENASCVHHEKGQKSDNMSSPNLHVWERTS